ncbi:DUF86 domain-containing protein [candidate division KSB1 bacterium]|nr:DUF86 domain-containing protein [candidate division KSB1 bacterium]
MPHDETYLLYMLLAARRVAVSVAGVTRQEFDTDLEKRDSVALQIGNVGEAASSVSRPFQDAHPELPWSKIIGTRNRIFHRYMEIDWDIVWNIATIELPQVAEQLARLVPQQ